MTLLGRTLIFVGMAAVTVICCLAFSNPSTNPVAGVVVWLPESIMGYDAQEEVMSEKERQWLPTDTTYWSMQYTPIVSDPLRRHYEEVKATLIVAGTDSRSLHRPEVCLGAQNWVIERRVVQSLETKGGALDVMDFHLKRLVRNPNDKNKIVLDQNGEPLFQRAHYVYWWVGPDHTTPDDKKRVWLSLFNSIRKGRNERWAYPSVMSYVDERRGEDGVIEAQERVFEFIRNYAPEFQKSLGAKDGKPGSRNLVTLTN